MRWFGELYGLHPMDGYQLLSQITEVPIANVVDANYSAVVKARKSLLPARDGLRRPARRAAQPRGVPALTDGGDRTWICS